MSDKLKNTLKATLAICSLLVLVSIPFVVYWANFGSNGLSKDSKTWGEFGLYINGMLAPMIAMAGAVISYSIYRSSLRNQAVQREREEMSKRPLCYIGYEDFEGEINIDITNKGAGPLIVLEVILKQTSGDLHVSFYDLITSRGITGYMFRNYTDVQEGLVLAPGETKNLLSFNKNAQDDTSNFESVKAKLRRELGETTIDVKYADLFENEMPVYHRNLEWFKRH